MARPGEKGPSLSDHPVHGPIELNNSKRGDGRSDGNERSDRTRRRDLHTS